LADRQWRKVLVISLIISLLSTGWYAKNYFKFGFFGASSLMGMNLWKIAAHDYQKEELAAFVKENVIESTVVDGSVFRRPSEYSSLEFNAKSDIYVLSRNDYNNINIIPIARMYQRNALRLILHNPIHYFQNVFTAYVRYTKPSSKYNLILLNAEKMRFHESISSDLIQGQLLARQFNKDIVGPFLFLLLPTSIFLCFIVPILTCRTSVDKWLDYIRTCAPLLFTAFIILYTTVVCCTFEVGENERFKFLVEQLLWAFIVSVLYRSFIKLKPSKIIAKS
jgi:hypothetical protein